MNPRLIEVHPDFKQTELTIVRPRTRHNLRRITRERFIWHLRRGVLIIPSQQRPHVVGAAQHHHPIEFLRHRIVAKLILVVQRKLPRDPGVADKHLSLQSLRKDLLHAPRPGPIICDVHALGRASADTKDLHVRLLERHFRRANSKRVDCELDAMPQPIPATLQYSSPAPGASSTRERAPIPSVASTAPAIPRCQPRTAPNTAAAPPSSPSWYPAQSKAPEMRK